MSPSFGCYIGKTVRRVVLRFSENLQFLQLNFSESVFWKHLACDKIYLAC